MKKHLKTFICKNCSFSFIPTSHSKNLFCSRSCSAIFNNKHRSKIHIEKQRNSLLKTNLLKKFNYPTINCSICDVCFCPLKKKMRVCSSECKKISKQRTAGNISKEKRIEMSRKGGKISASKFKKRSKDEIRLYDLCKNHFKSVENNKVLIDGWDADIILENEKIAILWNGPWHYRQMEHKNHSLEQVQTRDKIKINLFRKIGWNVLIFEDRYHTPETAFDNIKKLIVNK